MTPGLRRLYAPRRVRVDVSAEGSPRAVEGTAVAAIREEWWLEDRWWTPRPLRRHYYELALVDGSVVVVFRAARARWYRQQA